VRVSGYSLPQVEAPGVKMRLYAHQAAVLQGWDSTDAFLLVTKTGSGKTRAAALPVIRNRESAIFVYPTNALIVDQSRSIRQLMLEEGVTCTEWTPKNAREKLGSEEYALVQVSAAILEEFRKEWRLGSKGDALLRLLSHDKRKLVLINPDILFLIFELRYGRASAQAVGHLQAFTTAVFDEFHLYNGVELAHALFMMHLARRTGAFKRIVLLSATPSAEVRPYLDALIAPKEVTAEIDHLGPIVAERIVAHPVELLPLPVGAQDPVAAAAAKVLELVAELRQLQAENVEINGTGEYVPCVVIFNSVVNAIALEYALLAAGIEESDLASVRGLAARASRDVGGKLLVIGTSAIEVGIDFQVDHLLFDAGDAASFLQRFGRIGRHRPGKAWLLCDSREMAAMEALGAEISRASLEAAVNAIYPKQDAQAWFVTTFCGVISVCAQAENFKRKITEDKSADQDTKERVNLFMDDCLREYTSALGAEPKLKQTRQKLKRAWFHHYCQIDSFRTSIPTQTVWDISEKLRGREWSYEADVKTLLTRAERLRFNKVHRRLYVQRYGKWHPTWFAKSFEDVADLQGTIQTTADYPEEDMQFIREGHLTSVSHVMHKPRHHIFVFVPFALKDEIDWRIAWFRCGSKGRFIVAFDGDALLLKEVYDMSRT
jgi:CRISPR-associated endonuclease/helicase Cas3